MEDILDLQQVFSKHLSRNHDLPHPRVSLLYHRKLSRYPRVWDLRRHNMGMLGCYLVVQDQLCNHRDTQDILDQDQEAHLPKEDLCLELHRRDNFLLPQMLVCCLHSNISLNTQHLQDQVWLHLDLEASQAQALEVCHQCLLVLEGILAQEVCRLHLAVCLEVCRLVLEVTLGRPGHQGDKEDASILITCLLPFKSWKRIKRLTEITLTRNVRKLKKLKGSKVYPMAFDFKVK